MHLHIPVMVEWLLSGSVCGVLHIMNPHHSTNAKRQSGIQNRLLHKSVILISVYTSISKGTKVITGGHRYSGSLVIIFNSQVGDVPVKVISLNVT
jgi:hypothetical protein